MTEQEAMPDVIYHYTSVANLKAIVDSDELWATSLNYLNDVTEGKIFLEAAKSRLDKIEAFKRFNLASLISQVEAEGIDRSIGNLPFVVSFTKHRNTLSQWRSYCSRGNGVSVGFRTSRLRRNLFAPFHYRGVFGLSVQTRL